MGGCACGNISVMDGLILIELGKMGHEKARRTAGVGLWLEDTHWPFLIRPAGRR